MNAYDAVIVGSGFASSFFLHAYLQRMAPTARILVLERGSQDDHAWQLKHRVNSSIDPAGTFDRAGDLTKRWFFSLGFGGSSKCWWACTPRMLPNDFRMRTAYNVGRDWPLSYEELEGFYCDAEEIMQISGPEDGPFPRSRPYPQPPHHLTDPDRLLKARNPQHFFPMPTARARVATDTRGACCGNAVCGLCPVDAKFTVQNGIRADLGRLAGNAAPERRSVSARDHGRHRDRRSLHAPGPGRAGKGKLGGSRGERDLQSLPSAQVRPQRIPVGRRLHEQGAIDATVFLDGVDNFQGSTSITGHGYMLYDGPHRSKYAGCLMESWNQPFFRWERGRYRQILRLKFIFEDLPSSDNRVEISGNDPHKPVAFFSSRSDYLGAGIQALNDNMAKVLEGLPVERVQIWNRIHPTEAHILGTTVMGNDPADSVVDRHLVHHEVRNLLVLGGSVFPTGAPANPTLTLSALSLYAAANL